MPPTRGGTGNALTRKYGPLPGYVWVLLIGGGAYLYFRSHPTTPAPDAQAVDTSGLGAYGADPGYSLPWGSGKAPAPKRKKKKKPKK